MDFEFTPDEELFRDEVEDFVKTECPPDWDDRVINWPGGYGTGSLHDIELKSLSIELNQKLGKRGWLNLSWPKEYGGQKSAIKQAIVDDVLGYHRIVAGDISTFIGGPTIISVGSEEMKNEWLPKIAAGEARFWLGYSEPNSGSDLASIRTSAVEDGDDLIINGQKIWSTRAHVTDYAWMIARTDSSAPRHKGISLMIVDNKTPGVTIRPIINICGIHSFNEVFFDNVRVPKRNIVGEMNKGFNYLMLALQFERLLAWTGGFRKIFEELVQYVKETEYNGVQLSKDPLVQRRLTDMAIDIEILYGLYWRTAWMTDMDQTPQPEASGMKIFATELSRKVANAAMDILGLYGQLDRGSKCAPLKARICTGYLDSISGAIGAGTSEIQRGIIAMRGLGLPRG